MYLAWAGWIDTPRATAVVAQANPSLPELALVANRLSADATSVHGCRAGVTPPSTQPVVAVADADTSRAIGSATRCVSVGPFNDLARAARGAALLRERGFNPRQRAEQGEMWNGYWVYVGGLKLGGG